MYLAIPNNVSAVNSNGRWLTRLRVDGLFIFVKLGPAHWAPGPAGARCIHLGKNLRGAELGL